MNKSAASAASLDSVKFQAVIKSAASAASLPGGRASGRLDHIFFFALFGRASGPKITRTVQNSDSVKFVREDPKCCWICCGVRQVGGWPTAAW